jgi:hypothetical protein
LVQKYRTAVLRVTDSGGGKNSTENDLARCERANSLPTGLTPANERYREFFLKKINQFDDKKDDFHSNA